MPNLKRNMNQNGTSTYTVKSIVKVPKSVKHSPALFTPNFHPVKLTYVNRLYAKLGMID